MDNERYRAIPQVEKILESPNVSRWFPVLSRPLAARVVSGALESVRAGIRDSGTRPGEAEVLAAADAACARIAARRLRRVVNGTGVILHTNLGRAPLPRSVWESAAAVNTGYSTLEMDIATGRRGRRGGIVPDLLGVLTGCEDALVVNNNAAAVLLGLSALAAGREVVVSRGEQVQIGGGFRIPEILALSGARMVEVGTTNITTAEDYARALGPDTALVLAVHPSNFRIRGFTETPGTAAIARILPPGVVLAVDQGSGTTTEDIRGEEKVRAHLSQGAHLVFFSGDKVLGGPQAGIAAGRVDLVKKLGSHPLARALRPGKAVYSLLEELLVARLNGTAPGHAERILSLAEMAALGEREGVATLDLLFDTTRGSQGLEIALEDVVTRGVNLAVATMGLALVIQTRVLENSDLTGGMLGINVGDPTFLGMDFDRVAHPERYALLAFGIFIVAAILVSNLRRGRAGRCGPPG